MNQLVRVMLALGLLAAAACDETISCECPKLPAGACSAPGFAPCFCPVFCIADGGTDDASIDDASVCIDDGGAVCSQ
jgi:hypothetical protein